MSETPQQPSLRAALSGRWQIPLLMLGLLLFGGGLIRIAVAYQPVTFEEELHRVAALHDAGALRRASAYLQDLLESGDRPPHQRGELHRLLARAVHQSEAPMAVHARQNARSIVSHFQAAVRLSIVPEAADWVAVGNAYHWLGDNAEAADAFRQALRQGPARPDRLLRRLIELRLDHGRGMTAETLADLDAMLEDPSSSPDNYLWALERKVDVLLDKGEAEAALAVVREGETRLAGTADGLAVTYVEALCLSEEGTCYSAPAEALLRSLLADWIVRDELWARANWLLGRLQLIDGRPQAGMAFFDEAMQGFLSGPLHDACLLGRAEALSALERFERSLAVFADLGDRFAPEQRHRYLDRGAVRATITTIGESLLHAESVELGVAYLREAMSLADASDQPTQAYYLSRIAGGLSEMAETAITAATASAPDQQRGERLYAEAGEMYLDLAERQTLDEPAAAKSRELAVDCFDAAGLTERLCEVLALYVEVHPTSEWHAAALFRLGQAYQAMRRYPEAIAAYEEALEKHPRLLEAHASMVPLAECLIATGGASAHRGAALLIGIVDDSGPASLFDPQAKEYHDALIRLAEYYYRATEVEVPLHLEKAITRLEDAIAFFPEDQELTRLRFLLADAYRKSATVLRDQVDASLDARTTEEISHEADRRLVRAASVFQEVIAALAPVDASGLTELESTYLRASYLYYSDCLFDLGRHEAAIEANNEVVWRYENLPAAVSASMQIVHSYRRLGQSDEARAALERLSWLLQKIPVRAFEAERGMSSKQYWENMVNHFRGTNR